MKSINCLFLSCFTLGACFAQTITTVAGTGDSGFAGDGGPATMAQFSDPRSMAVDGQGNLYVVDNVNNRIRQLAPSGMITTVAGTGDISSPVEGAATQTGFIAIYGIAALPDGTLYVADSDGVQRVDPWGNLNFVVTGTAVPGVRVTPQGVFYTAGATVIYQLASDQSQTPVAGVSLGDSGDGGPATQAQFFVTDFTTDLAGNIYILDNVANRVRMFTPGGNINTIAGTGSPDFNGDGGLGFQAPLNNPSGIAVDVAGNVYISDTGNLRIRRLSTTGVINTFAGTGQTISNGDGGPALQASFNYPTYLAVSCTALYVTDTQRIRAIALTDPLIAQNGITNSATGALSIEMGTAFTISGCNLAGSSATADPTAPPVYALSGTSVTLNGYNVPVMSVSPTQVVVQLPFGFSSGRAVVVVTLDGNTTTATAATVIE